MSNYLLDTHVFAWLALDDPLLPEIIRDELMDPGNNVSVSIASIWEIGIKYSLKKWPLPTNIFGLEALAVDQSIDIVPISIAAINETTTMDWFNRDPFDRLIAASAIVRGDVLVTVEAPFEQWGVKRLWVR